MLTLVTLLSFPVMVYEGMKISAVVVDAASFVAEMAGQSDTLSSIHANFAALLRIPEWHLELLCHAYELATTDFELAARFLNCIRDSNGHATSEHAMLIQLPADSPHWRNIVSEIGIRLLQSPNDLLAELQNSVGYEILADRLFTLIRPEDMWQRMVAMRNYDWILEQDLQAAVHTWESMLLQVIDYWPISKRLLDDSAVTMSKQLYNSIVLLHRSKMSNEPQNLWRNDLRDAIGSEDGLEAMRRLLFLLPSVDVGRKPSRSPLPLPLLEGPLIIDTLSRKRKAPGTMEEASESETDEDDMIVTEPKKKRSYTPRNIEGLFVNPSTKRLIDNITNPDDMSVSWEEWRNPLEGDFRKLHALIWTRILASVKQSDNLTVKRRFVCFWLQHLKIASHSFLNTQTVDMLRNTGRDLIAADREWYNGVLEHYKDSIIMRSKVSRSDKWTEFIQTIQLPGLPQ